MNFEDVPGMDDPIIAVCGGLTDTAKRGDGMREAIISNSTPQHAFHEIIILVVVEGRGF